MKTAAQPTGSSNPETVNVPDTWENRIKEASVYLGISPNKTEEIMAEYGVEKEPHGLEMLSDEETTPFGDLRKEFCEKNEVKVPKLRIAMKALRGPKEAKKSYTDTVDPEILDLKTKYGIKLRLNDVDPAELLQHYHPEKSNHPITTALKERFGNKPVIIFKPDSKAIDIEETANYIADIEQGFPEQETVEVNGVLVRIYPVGQIPNQLVDEDPLFAGSPLKRGRSIVNRVNWSQIDEESRKLCRIIVQRNDIDVNDRLAIKELVKLASSKELDKVYPEAALEYKERELSEDLPKLRLALQEANGYKNNPFKITGNRQY